jgi:hypothetical protein
MYDTSTNGRWTLRDLAFAARLTIAVFLIALGCGYFSALVNLHFQVATPGEPLPTKDDVQRAYRGKSKVSPLERLLVAHPSLPFNGQGSMRSVFTKQRAGGWQKERRARAKELKIGKEAFANIEENNPKLARELDKHVATLLDGERRALIAWVRDKAPQKAYEDDEYELKGDLAKMPLADRMVVVGPGGTRAAKIKSIIETRCTRCHAESVGGGGAQFPLEKYEDIALYTKAEQSTGMSLTKLALTTHVHLLAFSMMYGMTGILFALTGFPGLVRLLLAPWPLLTAILEIILWWLPKMDDPYGSIFASAIPVVAAVGAVGFGLQILLTLFDLFGKYGRVVLLMLIFAAIGGGFGVKDRVVKYLENEKTAAGIESIAKE